MHDLPLRQYLDTSPMASVAWEAWLRGTSCLPCCLGCALLQRRQGKAVYDVLEARPENPVEWLAYYLLKNNSMGRRPKTSFTKARCKH